MHNANCSCYSTPIEKLRERMKDLSSFVTKRFEMIPVMRARSLAKATDLYCSNTDLQVTSFLHDGHEEIARSLLCRAIKKLNALDPSNF